MIALFGLGLVGAATRSGIGLEGDGYWYITASENVAAGRGFGRLNGNGELKPTTHFPPLYPVALASLQVVGMDKLASARWVNLAAFASLLLLTAAVVRAESRSNYPSFAAEAIVATSAVVFGVSVWALSEPLFLVLSLAGLWTLTVYLDRDKRSWLVVAAVFSGLAYLTRYIGIALVGTAALILLVQKRPWRKKLSDAGILLVIALAPMILWWTRNFLMTGNLADRRIIWHPFTYSQAKSLLLHFIEWVVPAEFIGSGLQAAGLLLLLVVAIAAILLRMKAARLLAYRLRLRGMPFLLVLYVGTYLAALVISISVFDEFTNVGSRILSPVFLSLVILAAFILWDAWQIEGRLVRGAILLTFLFTIAWAGSRQSRLALSHGAWGLGNASLGVRESPITAAVRELPDVPIVTNVIPRLYFWADRDAFGIPWRVDIETNELDPAYEANLETLRSRLCGQNGYLVLFFPETMAVEHADLAELTQGLILHSKHSDGEIYECGSI